MFSTTVVTPIEIDHRRLQEYQNVPKWSTDWNTVCYRSFPARSLLAPPVLLPYLENWNIQVSLGRVRSPWFPAPSSPLQLPFSLPLPFARSAPWQRTNILPVQTHRSNPQAGSIPPISLQVRDVVRGTEIARAAAAGRRRTAFLRSRCHRIACRRLLLL